MTDLEASATADQVLFRTVLDALALPVVPRRVASPLAGAELVARLFTAIWPPDLPTWTAAGLPALPGRAVELADAAVVLARATDLDVVVAARTGTAHDPADGATVILLASPDRTPVEASGAGLPDRLTAVLPVPPALLGVRALRCTSPPSGIDLLVVDGRDLVGLPRGLHLTSATS